MPIPDHVNAWHSSLSDNFTNHENTNQASHFGHDNYLQVWASHISDEVDKILINTAVYIKWITWLHELFYVEDPLEASKPSGRALRVEANLA